jgi:hypothetical protein
LHPLKSSAFSRRTITSTIRLRPPNCSAFISPLETIAYRWRLR